VINGTDNNIQIITNTRNKKHKKTLFVKKKPPHYSALIIVFSDQAIELHGVSLNVRGMGVLGLSMRVVRLKYRQLKHEPLDSVLGECNAPCPLTTSIGDFEKE
jgi:hypothetical protein